MGPRFCLFAVAWALVASRASFAWPADDQLPKPIADTKPIDFAHEIAPLLQKRCAKCHIGTQQKGGLSLNTRQTLLAGGDSGPAVVRWKSAASELIKRVTSSDPDLKMPPEGERLTPAQIDLLKRWIDGDLPWEDGFAFGKVTRQAPLAPRRPAVPAVPDPAGVSHPIDRFLHGYFVQHQVRPAGLVADQAFARRAAFDLTGLAPTPDELAALQADGRADRREHFIERLLADREAYTAHWLTFWNDLLRNAYHGTGFIDGGRKQITGWLYGALYDNAPYDQFVHDLVSPSRRGGSEGFTFGIKWRGTVNESQRREIQAAQSVAQVFLGTNLKCASCHDSFVNHWKLVDAYALSSVFAEAPLELHRCDQPTGVPSTVAFLYPQLGSIDAGAPLAEKQRQLADLLTHPDNGRLSRTIVNRLWARLFGRGLVEPLDNMDAEPWQQDLLDWLATDLADHQYNLKHTLRVLATSRAYQLPGVAVDPAATGDSFVFRGPFLKRLLAEQFVDTVFALTATRPGPEAALLKRDGRGQGGQLGAVAAALTRILSPPLNYDKPPLSQAKWVWSRAEAREAAPPQTIYLRRVWSLEQRPARAIATLAADNSIELYVNGKTLAKSENWKEPAQLNLGDVLVAGKNVVALKVVNGGPAPNPAGAIAEILVFGADGQPQTLLATDESWDASETAAAAWLEPGFDDPAWKAAAVLGDSTIEPWRIAETIGRGLPIAQVSAPLPQDFRIRAALLPLDPLQAALGRPSREQVVSARDTVPTMLQALELTNGNQLSQLLKRGAEVWHARSASDSRDLINQIYLTALNRLPSAAEADLSVETVGKPATLEGIEDLLWTICMLPEFQLVP